MALSFERSFDVSDDVALRLGLAVGGTVFVYQDFVGLDDVLAGDATLALTLEL